MKNRTRNWLMAVAVVLSVASAQGKVRVALIGSDLSESGEAALGLAEVAISGRNVLELLDRSMIGKVLQEHKLVADGFAQSEDAIQLGQILAVDVFIHVEPISGQKALAVSAFETVQGIRLLDEVIAGDDASELAEGLAAGVDKALAKWRAPAGQFTAIAVMSVRNVDLPRSRNAECDSLGALLERRLLGSPDVVVVERKRLESLNRDHEITMDHPSDRLLSAPVLLELDVARLGEKDGVQVAAHLLDAHGSVLEVARAEGNSLPALSTELAADILRLLKAGEAPLADPDLEAARFSRQVAFRAAHGRNDLMLAAAEAAYALDPDNRTMGLQLVHSLFAVALDKATESRSDSLEHAARGMALLRGLDGDPKHSGSERHRRFLMATQDAEQFSRQYGRAIEKFRQTSPFTPEEAASYADLCRDWLACSAFSPDRKSGPSQRDMWLLAACDGLVGYFSSTEDYWRELSAQVKQWCAKNPPQGRSSRIPSFFSVLITAGDPTQGTPPADYRIRADLWNFLEEQADPLLGFYGRCGQIVDASRLSPDDRTAIEQKARALLKEIQTAILNGAPEHELKSLYKIAQLTIQRHGRNDSIHIDRTRTKMQRRLSEMRDMAGTMIQSGKLSTDLLEEFKEYIAMVERAGQGDLCREMLISLEEDLAALARTTPEAFNPEELASIDAFCNWVKDKRLSASTRPLPSENIRIEPIAMIRPEGDFLGYAAILGDEQGGAYVVSASQKPAKLILQHWMPGTRKPSLVGEVEPCGPHGNLHSSYLVPGCGIKETTLNVAGVVDACLGQGKVAVAAMEEGIFVFDLSSPSVERLHETTSLPLTRPLSVGFLGATLFVGTADGYLVSIDLNTRFSEIVVASSRKEKKSPFDDGLPAQISAIIPDPDRERIVFVISVMTAETQLDPAVSPLSGVWEYRPAAGEFRQLVSLPHRRSDVAWCGKGGGHDFVLYTRGYQNKGVFRFDMISDSMDLLTLNSPGWVGKIAEQIIQEMPPSEDCPYDQRRAFVAPPFLMHGDWLWTAAPFGCLSMKTFQWKPCPSLRLPDGTGKAVLPNMGMVSVGDRQVLLAEQSQLWLMTEDGEP